MSNALPLKREAAGPAATPASKRPRDCNSSDCSSSSSCGLKGTDAAVDTSDYECSICLSLLVDPVVGRCTPSQQSTPTHRRARMHPGARQANATQLQLAGSGACLHRNTVDVRFPPTRLQVSAATTSASPAWTNGATAPTAEAGQALAAPCAARWSWPPACSPWVSVSLLGPFSHVFKGHVHVEASSSGMCAHSLAACMPMMMLAGVCVRLQRMVEQRFPQQLKERRAEVAAVVVERTAAKQAEVQQQAAGVQDIMRARFARVAHIMGPHQGFAAAPLNPLTGTTYASSIPAPVLAVPSQPAIPVAMWTCASSQQAAAGPSSSAPRPTSSWHRPAADAGLRQSTIQALVSVFASRRPDMSEAFRRRLPNLVRKLEEVLYRTASSREEYADQNRLQSRVQAIVRQLTESRIQQRPGMVAAAAAASHMAAATVAPMVWGPVLAPVIAVGLPVHHVLQGSIAM